MISAHSKSLLVLEITPFRIHVSTRYNTLSSNSGRLDFCHSLIWVYLRKYDIGQNFKWLTPRTFLMSFFISSPCSSFSFFFVGLLITFIKFAFKAYFSSSSLFLFQIKSGTFGSQPFFFMQPSNSPRMYL